MPCMPAPWAPCTRSKHSRTWPEVLTSRHLQIGRFNQARVLLQFDAGSCIDGRLTSAWNWGSKIEKKPYYHIFKIAGFVGFDGEFKG